MKAKVLRANFVGADSNFFIDEVDVPDLGPDEVLVKVNACSVYPHREKIYQQLLSNSLKSCHVGQDVSGQVVDVGSDVEMFQEGMAVVGIVPLGAKLGGCGDMCVMNQFDIIEKPASLSDDTAVAALGSGLSAYTAVHYLGHVTAGDTVLVIDGATPHGYLTVQAAQAWGAKVVSTYKTISEKQLLEGLKTPVAQLIDLTHRTNILASAVMEETGGVGVDVVIDNGVRLFTSEEDKDLMGERILQSTPHKYEIIACLGFSGKWITTQPNLQLDPPDSQQLFLRGSSLAFLFPPAWTLMKAQHGRYQHILKDLMNRVQSGEFKCNDVYRIPLNQAPNLLLQNDMNSTKCPVIIP